VLLQQVLRKRLHCTANEQRRIGLPQRDNLGLVSFQFATALQKHLGAFKLASAYTFTLA